MSSYRCSGWALDMSDIQSCCHAAKTPKARMQMTLSPLQSLISMVLAKAMPLLAAADGDPDSPAGRQIQVGLYRTGFDNVVPSMPAPELCVAVHAVKGCMPACCALMQHVLRRYADTKPERCVPSGHEQGRAAACKAGICYMGRCDRCTHCRGCERRSTACSGPWPSRDTV